MPRLRLASLLVLGIAALPASAQTRRRAPADMRASVRAEARTLVVRRGGDAVQDSSFEASFRTGRAPP